MEEEKNKVDNIENNILNEEAVLDKEKKKIQEIGKELETGERSIKKENQIPGKSNDFVSRTEKIKNWFKDPYFLGFIGIMILAFAIRMYFFWITKNQAVWWDEGEYMVRVKHIVLGTASSGFFSGRELFTPYLWSVFYYLSKSEVLIRFIQVIISTLTVAVTYFLGKEVYDKRTGLIGSLLMTFFWLHLFFTCRLLTYLYTPLFYTLALVLFWKGYCSELKQDKYLFLSFVTIIIGLGIYSSITFAAITIVLYLLLTEKFAFLKNKRLWKYGLLSLPFLLLSFIPSYIVQGSFIPRLTQMGEATQQGTGLGLPGILTYFSMMPRLTLLIWTILLILSLLVVVRIFFYVDLILKNKAPAYLKKDLFIFLGALVQFVFYTYVAMKIGGSYDAWILGVFPFLFILIARFVFEVKDYFSKVNINYGKVFVLVILIILAISCYQHFQFADSSIKAKIPSFQSLIPAGEWIKQHSNLSDIVISSSLPQMAYYSERETYPYLRNVPTADDPTIRLNESDFDNFVQLKKPRYITDSLFEAVPDWVHVYAQKHNDTLTPVQAYYLDAQKTQLSLIIYEVKYA